jgi:hypothetical protein
MSCDKFDPNCSGCRPAILNLNGKVLPADDPFMVIVNNVWDESPPDEQEAFWRVTVKNSRDPNDLAKAKALADRISARNAN